MAFGMMAPKGKMPMKKASEKVPMKKGPGNPMNTKGGKNTVPPTNDKMPGSKQAASYNKPAPSDKGIRAVKELPAKSKGKVPVPFMKKGAK